MEIAETRRLEKELDDLIEMYSGVFEQLFEKYSTEAAMALSVEASASDLPISCIFRHSPSLSLMCKSNRFSYTYM